MEAILEPLSDSDGVACFTRLYLDVTEGVQAQLQALTFADPAFIADLDVRFANLYFDAVDEASKPGRGNVPRASAPRRAHPNMPTTSASTTSSQPSKAGSSSST
jgi:hypothetical protein